MNQQIRWTDGMIESAVSMWNEGLSLTEIGKRFGISRSATAGIVYRNRTLFHARPTGRAKTKIKENKVPKQIHIMWTPEKLELASKLWANGVPAVDIAAHLEVKISSFLSTVQRYREMFPARKKPVIKREPTELEKQCETESASEFQRSEGFDLRRFQIADTDPIAFVDLDRHQCRFPLEDFETLSGPDTPCCGKTVQHGKSYCVSHMRLMYRPYVQKHG